MNSYSQAGQDRFVHAIIPRTGTFIDIGCGGKQFSNTLGLEELGWVGILIDNRPNALDVKRSRDSKFICGDARSVDWRGIAPMWDYLSLDVDEHSLDALRNMPLDRMRFRIITAEHNLYLSPSLKEPMSKLLADNDYICVCDNVCNENLPFEDWWVTPELYAEAKRFRCSMKEGSEIVP